jgi:imidazole glycerol-phosphate synthase subunit HisH
MIAIVDSGIANVNSVQSACRRIGFSTTVVKDAESVRAATAVILPGVGAFANGMESLRRNGLVAPLREVAAAGTPILGICLGMQLLAETSEEFGMHEGLGFIPGRVVRLTPAHPGERVPNIGWCDVTAAPTSRTFSGISNGSPFYFVHSYYVVCAESDHSIGTILFGSQPICAAVERGNIFGTQFHPEKSQGAGLQVLHNFLKMTRKEGLQ